MQFFDFESLVLYLLQIFALQNYYWWFCLLKYLNLDAFNTNGYQIFQMNRNEKYALKSITYLISYKSYRMDFHE